MSNDRILDAQRGILLAEAIAPVSTAAVSPETSRATGT
jgi:hypothetical protein